MSDTRMLLDGLRNAIAAQVKARRSVASDPMTSHLTFLDLDAEPVLTLSDAPPRRQGPWLIYAVTAGYPTEDEGVGRAWGRLVREASRADPTLGGSCLRTVIDETDATAAVTVRIVTRG